MIKVTLTKKEQVRAIKIGVLRHTSSLEKNFKENYKADKTELGKIADSINGAAGELAYCKCLNVDWPESVDTPGEPDVVINGNKIDVKTTTYRTDLIIRPGTVEKYRTHDWWYVHVRGDLPDYEVHGRILVRDGMREQYKKDPNSRGWGYFVPQENLPVTYELVNDLLLVKKLQ
jgi:hypothetical protein